MERQAGLLDIPPELLEKIFGYLRLDLTGSTRLATVCSRFRDVVYRVPLVVRIPLQDDQLRVFTAHKIPVSFISNNEPCLFIKYQIGRLNLSRLRVAQLVSHDYLAKNYELSPHYIEVLQHLAFKSSHHLSQLLVNVDLVRNEGGDSLQCSELIGKLTNLTYLSLHFTPQIELQQKITGKNYAQKLLNDLTSRLKKLKTLYIVHCPCQSLTISSESLEKLGIYKSEFVEVDELHTPKLKTFMFQHGFRKLVRDRAKNKDKTLLDVLYDGCPELQNFNSCPVGVLKKHNLSNREWSFNVIKLLSGTKQAMSDYR